MWRILLNSIQLCGSHIFWFLLNLVPNKERKNKKGDKDNVTLFTSSPCCLMSFIFLKFYLTSLYLLLAWILFGKQSDKYVGYQELFALFPFPLSMFSFVVVDWKVWHLLFRLQNNYSGHSGRPPMRRWFSWWDHTINETRGLEFAKNTF